MIYLLLSILASTFIFLIFKLFDRFKVNTLQAIVFNYIVACLCGIVTYCKPIDITEITQEKWFFGAIALGFLFIFIFNVMAITAQQNGISVASVATKMSVIIPVFFGIYMYGESTGIQKIIGILLALLAVYFVSIKPNSNIHLKNSILLPFILFLGSGIIDTSIKYLETTYVSENGIPIFSATIFCFAACIGLCILLYKTLKKEFKFNPQSLIGGTVLGIVNYVSIYYILKALDNDSIESSTIFTVNNVAIVMLSSLVGLILFKEKLSIKNWIGVSFAIISILLVTLS
ncbi:DMT family transporter [Formosa maritima]|uniref:DMT family transporter n=1 Tax=Formosa maritima TaxID=2592046 RepID=A0A5D0GEP0_9FLAO|nr:DMT family transporter [Formosa maritima]TYA57251.1 DMT family transporter [Formosa maritima]